MAKQTKNYLCVKELSFTNSKFLTDDQDHMSNSEKILIKYYLPNPVLIDSTDTGQNISD